ncbi:thyroid hormone-inducible hepatic protein [Hemicordylus capensis]|uniref:thyroid hormone-inducible hepatic protein n=1 Tax=Hemicordylus capensis TaxID=884348 RepID=UPI002303D8A9|nr:thyroid hormone-inducible hepatic protein [Hemicordylus capensis]
MEGYFSAVHKMEQTVLFPSLLQGVTLEEQDDTPEAGCRDKDLYECFTLLKSIKMVAEGGLAALGHQNHSISTSFGEEESPEKADLEGLFHYHVSGLHQVLTHLTRRAKTMTSKYKDIMGQIYQNEMSLHW